MLPTFVEHLRRIFSGGDLYEAHRQAEPVLLGMAKCREVLLEVVKQSLANSDYLRQGRSFPVIALPIESNCDFELIAHCWLPLPDQAPDVSHQSIHHHGHLLLTSASAFGSGYESIIFEKGFELDRGTQQARMRVRKIYRNQLHNLEFIDAYTPHVVFFPERISVTYALWSPNQKRATARIKKLSFLRQYKKPIKRFVNALGLSSRLGLNAVEYLDYYPDKDKLLALQDRVKYEAGSHCKFVQNLMYVLQEIGFDDHACVKETVLPVIRSGGDERTLDWVTDFLDDKKIPGAVDECHVLADPRINFRKEDVLRVIAR